MCVERSTGKPHQKVSHPAAYSLSIDTAGPFREKGAAGHRYLLVACYRFPKLPGTKEGEGREELGTDNKAPPRPADGEDWLFDHPEPPDEPRAT